MNEGIKTVLYPVKDVARAKARFTQLLGTEPYADQPYYVGFKVAGQDIGLVPEGSNGMTGAIAYYHVGDIQASLQGLLDTGGETQQQVRNVGGGRLVASVQDADGNVIGLIQDPS